MAALCPQPAALAEPQCTGFRKSRLLGLEISMKYCSDCIKLNTVSTVFSILCFLGCVPRIPNVRKGGKLVVAAHIFSFHFMTSNKLLIVLRMTNLDLCCGNLPLLHIISTIARTTLFKKYSKIPV